MRWYNPIAQNKSAKKDESGYSLVELVIGLTIFAMVALALIGLFTALVQSSLLIKRKSVALTLATNQMEYLKSLPYNSLVIAGGSIYGTAPLPANTYNTVNGVTYRTNTSINYVDDAYDGCGSYGTPALKALYCKNQPAPTGAPATDTNPADYKIVHVVVYNSANVPYAEVDTQISARVAETASTTGALFVTVIDDNGNPVSGANINVVNSTLTPNVNLNDSSDANGVAIFYNLPPDTTGYDYTVTASKSGYSTLSTIKPFGSLTPTYPSQNIFSQLSSYVTLVIKPMVTNSLIVEATDTSGNPIASLRVSAKGGYKKYTSTTNTEYYYNNFDPTDVRATTGGDGVATFSSLTPGEYIFCDGSGSGCRIGNNNYYLVAALPYSGSNSFNPVNVPSVPIGSTPNPVFNYSGNDYVQKVRLMFSTDSSFPSISTITPDEASIANDNLSAFEFQIDGKGIPCSASAGACATTVRILQGGSTYTASCTGTADTHMDCTVNMSGATAGLTQLQIVVGSKTLTVPAGSMMGGINVTP
ncbi:MAG: carboxypeptidase regulatory-like domain-containing protein [Patescibacteria group bacterium]